jgi:hypothetical protein
MWSDLVWSHLALKLSYKHAIQGMIEGGTEEEEGKTRKKT